MTKTKMFASKTYGAWKVTEQEYRTALSLSDGDGPLADAAWQLVRYCRGEIFNRDQAAEAGRMIRARETPNAPA
jgi:hypothetical protein